MLGGIVTFTHTFSIILLGLLTSIAATYFVPETVHEVLEIVSGLLIVGVGFWMIYNRIIPGRSSHGHSHGPAHSHQDEQHQDQSVMLGTTGKMKCKAVQRPTLPSLMGSL